MKSGKGKGTPTKLRRSLFWQAKPAISTTTTATSSSTGRTGGDTAATTSSSSTAVGGSGPTMGSRAEQMLPPPVPTPPFFEESEESSQSQQSSLNLELEDSEDLFAGREELQASSPPRSTPPTSQSCGSTQPSSQGVTGSASGSGLCRPRGVLWQHFDSQEEDPRLAMCRHCKVVVRRGNDPKHLSSSSLRNHLLRKHPGMLQGPAAAGTGPSGTGRKRGVGEAGSGMEAGQTSTERAKRQATLKEVMPLSAGFVSQRARDKAQEATTRVVGEMVAMSGLPLSFVESAGFRHLLKHLAPWYEPPSRRTLSRRVMPSLYDSVREMVRAHLQQARGRKVHFTTDLWTGGHHGYLSLTAHWWQPEDVLGSRASEEEPQGEAQGNTRGYRVALLQAQSMEDSATGTHIAEVLMSALRDWAPEGQVKRGYVVTDAGRNMLSALHKAGLDGIVCTAHKLHLVVHDALGLGPVRDTWCEGTRETKALLDKCRQLVGHFSRSVKAARMLREKQGELGQAEHVLLQDLPTRWNSTYEMVKRLVEQRDVLESIMSTTPILPGGRELDIGATDWLALAQMVGILRPFEDTTNVLSGHNASLGHVLPLVHALRQGLESSLREDSSLLPRSTALAERLLTGVDTRLRPLSRERVYRLACLCDPRVKGSLAGSVADLHTWKAELCREVRRAAAAQGQALPRTQAGQSEEEEGSSQGSSSFSVYTQRPSTFPSTYLASALAMAVSCSVEGREAEEQDPARTMVREYMAEPLQPLTSDPLRYWARKAEIWPTLSSLALDLLSIPPTSVQSERVFSHMGDILRPRRSRLDPGTVERLTFIRFNLSTLGFPHPNP